MPKTSTLAAGDVLIVDRSIARHTPLPPVFSLLLRSPSPPPRVCKIVYAVREPRIFRLRTAAHRCRDWHALLTSSEGIGCFPRIFLTALNALGPSVATPTVGAAAAASARTTRPRGHLDILAVAFGTFSGIGRIELAMKRKQTPRVVSIGLARLAANGRFEVYLPACQQKGVPTSFKPYGKNTHAIDYPTRKRTNATQSDLSAL